MLRTFYKFCFEEFCDKVALWIHQEVRKAFTFIYSREGADLISQFGDSIFFLISVLLNVFLTVFIASIYIEKTIILTAIFGFLFSSFLMFITFSTRKKLILNHQNAKLQLTNHLSIAWDNISLANTYNQQCWKNFFLIYFKSFTKAYLRLYFFINLIRLCMALSFTLPATFIIIKLNLNKVFTLSGAHALTMLIALPRLFQALSQINNFISSISEFRTSFLKINLMWSHFSFTQENLDINLKKIQTRIKEIKIFNHANHKTINPKEAIHCPNIFLTPGRITIQGPNGSGKSTFLFFIKLLLKKNALYIPFNNDLTFQANKSALSTGEYTKKIIYEISDLNIQMLILDEWAANLDNNSKKEISCLLDELSKKICVLETKH